MASLDNLLNSDWSDSFDENVKAIFFTACKKADVLFNSTPDSIFPPKNKIFAALNFTALSEIKVVILGQDPYPTKHFANGLCFSVSPLTPIPKSLKNIYTELKSDIGREMHENGDLSRWATQGVLLLNSILTVEEGKPDSHSKLGWEKFTDAIIELISKQNQHLVFLLWGTKAQQKIKLINQEKHLVLKAPHPSPLSVYRGFYGCKHFSKANEYLMKNGKNPIAW